MARLSDVRPCLQRVGIRPFCQRVLREVSDDNLFTWAAALAYSWLFAIFPFFIFLLAMLPHLPEYAKAQAEREIQHTLYKVLSNEAADTLWKNIDIGNLLHRSHGKLLSLGLLLALWAAAGGMTMTMSALDRCYDLDRVRPFYMQRLIAIGLTILVIVLLLGVICLLPAGTMLKTWWLKEKFPYHLIIVFDLARWSLAILFMISVLAFVYFWGPSVRQHFHWLTPGAAVCVVVWIALALGFRLYIQRVGGQSYTRTYGAVGGVAILLLFFYIDALVLLIGAEINSEIDFEVLQVRRGASDFRRAEDATHPAPTSL